MSERVELGCAGHFIGAKDCAFRRHTQVPGYRISTVGDYLPPSRDGRVTLGADEDSFFETYVFRTTCKSAEGSEGCGCMEVADWSEIDSERYATAGEAQAGHERFVAKYMQVRS